MKKIQRYLHRCFVVTFIFLMLASGVEAGKLNFENSVTIGSRLVPLHGTGIRTATLFAFKIYEAAFYNPAPAHTLQEIRETPYPKRIEIRYLRDVSLTDVKQAWEFQFRESVPEAFENLKADVERLNTWQTAIEEGDTHRFDIFDSEVQFSINGQLKGAIRGSQFRDSVLALFFGDRPPTQDLKRGLLGGSRSAE